MRISMAERTDDADMIVCLEQGCSRSWPTFGFFEESRILDSGRRCVFAHKDGVLGRTSATTLRLDYTEELVMQSRMVDSDGNGVEPWKTTQTVRVSARKGEGK